MELENVFQVLTSTFTYTTCGYLAHEESVVSEAVEQRQCRHSDVAREQVWCFLRLVMQHAMRAVFDVSSQVRIKVHMDDRTSSVRARITE